MAIWVIKDGQREGPYEERDVRELVYEGTYADSDPAIRDGQFDWSTLGQVLGRQPSDAEPAEPPAAPAPPELPSELPAPEPPVATEPEEPIAPPLAPVPADRPVQVAVVDFEMPFGSMVALMVKWVLASIPALLILGMILAGFWVGIFAMIAVIFHH